MLRVVLVLLGVAVYIYCIIDVLRSRSNETRTLPRWIWLLVVILLPLVGDALWLVFGRVWPVRRRGGGPVAPDDDPRFLKQLDDDVWVQRMKQRRAKKDDEPA